MSSKDMLAVTSMPRATLHEVSSGHVASALCSPSSLSCVMAAENQIRLHENLVCSLLVSPVRNNTKITTEKNDPLARRDTRKRFH